ncbi:MAG: hypothetical protein H0X50_03970 [Nitrosopumilus sp.]|nr:hypothetical protein [Nitrosopumilus sp.]
MLKISVNGVDMPAKSKLLTDGDGVDGVVKRFKSKYGGDVKRYYTNIDVAIVEVPL